MTNSKLAITNFFDCETMEDREDFTKVRVTAEIILNFQAVNHINTNEVKTKLQQAVKDAVWFDNPPRKPKEGDNAK